MIYCTTKSRRRIVTETRVWTSRERRAGTVTVQASVPTAVQTCAAAEGTTPSWIGEMKCVIASFDGVARSNVTPAMLRNGSAFVNDEE